MAANWIKERTALVNTAMGREKADLVVKNGIWVCVQTGELIPGTDIAVKDEKIAFVGSSADHTVGVDTVVIDAQGKYLSPGLLDGHVHVESGMLTVTEFVNAVYSSGTTGLFIDPHEIANVFGLDGVKLMVDEAKEQPIHVWVQIPSCVPSAPGLETPGASIGPEEVKEAMQWEGVIGLGEMMNFPGVFNSDKKMLAEIGETYLAGKTVGGHYASPDLGRPFHGYAAGGAEDDHEGTSKEDAVARARQGMKPMLRYGSAWHDVETQIKAITEDGLDSSRFILCTDDSHSETLINHGHMNRVVRHAIEQNIEPIKAYQMATINTAVHFGVDKQMGLIAPGRFADILIIDDLEDVSVQTVICKGKLLVNRKEDVYERKSYPYPDWVQNSVKIDRKFSADDFKVKTELTGPCVVNVIGIIENQAPTKHLRLEMKPENGEIKSDIERDILKIAVIERHKPTGKVQVGFVQGFGLKAPCGAATTVAHDCHQMIVIGTSEADMAEAVNQLSRYGGGQVVIIDGNMEGKVELPIAGLMANKPARIVAKEAESVLDSFRKAGCKINNPNMQLSLSALVVIPEIRISDLGIVNVKTFSLINLIEPK